MICPHCYSQLKIKEGSHPFEYVDNYGGFARSRTKCCDNIVSISRVMAYNVIAVPTNSQSVDDWGN